MKKEKRNYSKNKAIYFKKTIKIDKKIPSISIATQKQITV